MLSAGLAAGGHHMEQHVLVVIIALLIDVRRLRRLPPNLLEGCGVRASAAGVGASSAVPGSPPSANSSALCSGCSRSSCFASAASSPRQPRARPHLGERVQSSASPSPSPAAASEGRPACRWWRTSMCTRAGGARHVWVGGGGGGEVARAIGAPREHRARFLGHGGLNFSLNSFTRLKWRKASAAACAHGAAETALSLPRAPPRTRRSTASSASRAA